GGGARVDRHRDVVARVLRVAGQRLLLDAGEVGDRAELRGRRGDRRADPQAGVRPQVGERDDERGAAARLDVDPRAVGLAGEDVRGDSDDRAVYRRVDVGARD